MTERLSEGERRAIEADCERLIKRYVNLNDAQDWPAVAALYTEDARFARPSQPGVFIEGRAAILASFLARPARAQRHVIANVVIEVVRDPANRRRKWLTLTKEGQRLYEIMRPQSEKVADYLFSELDQTEVEQLGAILTHLIDTLEAKDAEGQSLFLERTKPEGRTTSAARSRPTASG